jgi:hypothetical protein
MKGGGCVQGAYVMPPFGRYKVAMEVLEGFIERPVSEAWSSSS